MIKYKVCVSNKGTIRWYNEEWKLHRLDGPAIECIDGAKHWYQENLRHRLDGPAIEVINKYKAWYIKGKELSEEDFNKRVNGCKGKIVEIDGVKYRLTQI